MLNRSSSCPTNTRFFTGALSINQLFGGKDEQCHVSGKEQSWWTLTKVMPWVERPAVSLSLSTSISSWIVCVVKMDLTVQSDRKDGDGEAKEESDAEVVFFCVCVCLKMDWINVYFCIYVLVTCPGPWPCLAFISSAVDGGQMVIHSYSYLLFRILVWFVEVVFKLIYEEISFCPPASGIPENKPSEVCPSNNTRGECCPSVQESLWQLTTWPWNK